MKNLLMILWLLILLALSPGCVVSEGGRHVRYWPPPVPGLPPSHLPLPPPPVGYPHRFPTPSPPLRREHVSVVFSAQEHAFIEEYVRVSQRDDAHHKGKRKGWKRGELPPGLAKKAGHEHELPPGWREKFKKGQVLPIEVYQKCHSLPNELVVQLPKAPVGTVTVAIDGRVLRLLHVTHEILDVFEIGH